MKLFKVTCTFDFVVAAEDHNEAYSIGRDQAGTAYRDMSSDCAEIDVSDYTSGSVDGWDDLIEPYGESNGKTTAEIMLESTPD